MNLFFIQPNRFAVLIGTFLCLWGSFDWFYCVIKDCCLTTAILSPVALSPTEKYYYYIDLANRCLYRTHKYKSAACYADMALRNRVVVDSFSSEESFASTLIDLGKYEQAKYLVLTMAPLKNESPEYCLEPMVAYRQVLLGRSYMGLHQYQAAAQILGKDVPGLIPENGTRGSLEFGAFLANVCSGDNSAAKKILKHWRQTKHFYERRPVSDEADNPVLTFFESSMDLLPSEVKIAKQLSADYIRFWEKAENSSDADAVPMLKMASKVMQDHGFSSESGRLMTCAERLKIRTR